MEAVAEVLQKDAEGTERNGEALSKALSKALTAETKPVTTRTSALEKSMEDVVARYGDLASITIPKMRTDISVEVEKLTEVVMSQRQEAEKSKIQHEATMASAISQAIGAASAVQAQRQETILEQVRAALDAKISSEMQALSFRLDNSEAAVASAQASASAEAASESSRLTALSHIFRSQLQAESSRLETLSTSQTTKALDEFRGDLGSRLDFLEAAFKQFDVERLVRASAVEVESRAFQERMESITGTLRSEISACQRSTTQRFDEVAGQQTAALAQVQVSVDQRLQTLGEAGPAFQALVKRVEAVCTDTSALRIALSKAEEERIRHLEEYIKAAYASMKTVAKEEVRNERSIVREEENQRLEALELALRQVKEERRVAAEGGDQDAVNAIEDMRKFFADAWTEANKEIAAVRAEATSNRDHAERQLQSLAAAWTTRMDRMTQVVSEFSKHVQDADESLESTEHRFLHLEQWASSQTPSPPAYRRFVREHSGNNNRYPWRTYTANARWRSERSRSASPPGATRSASTTRTLEAGGARNEYHQDRQQEWETADNEPLTQMYSSQAPALAQASMCSCGSIFMEDSAFCRKCGARRTQETTQRLVSSSAAPVPVSGGWRVPQPPPGPPSARQIYPRGVLMDGNAAPAAGNAARAARAARSPLV